MEERVCSAPALVNVSNITDTSAVLSWPSASEAEQYIIKVVESGNSWTGAFEKRTSGSATTITFDNLLPGKNYLTKVQSNCAGSNSDFTSEFSFRTFSAKEFDLTKKWRIAKFQSNGINLVLQPGDYVEFKMPDVFNQVLLSAPSAGTWSFAGPGQDSLLINAGAIRRYRIRTLSSSAFTAVGMGNISGDTLQLIPF